jgi:hypothetical protein
MPISKVETRGKTGDHRKKGSLPAGKTKEEKAFYVKYGIWGTAKQVAELGKWKKRQGIWGGWQYHTKLI